MEVTNLLRTVKALYLAPRRRKFSFVWRYGAWKCGIVPVGLGVSLCRRRRPTDPHRSTDSPGHTNGTSRNLRFLGCLLGCCSRQQSQRNNVLAISRPHWPTLQARIIGNVAFLLGFNVNGVNLAVSIPIRCKRNLFSVPRPRRLRFAAGMVRYSLNVCAVGIHDVDVIVSVPIASEGNFLSIVREHRFTVLGGMIGQVSLATPIGPHQVDFAISIPPRT